MHKFLSGLYVIENGPLEYEITPIDPHVGFARGFDFLNQSAIAQRDIVTARAWPDAEKGGSLVSLMERVNQLGKIEVREIVTVVRQEFRLAIQVLLDSFKSLADIRVSSGIYERDRPVLDITIKDLYVPAAVQKDKVIGDEFTVIDEVILDHLGAITQAQDELLVAEMSIVLHHVPQDRPVTDMNDGLGCTFARFFDPHALPTAEKNNFHGDVTPRQNLGCVVLSRPYIQEQIVASGIGTMNWPPHSRIKAICCTISLFKFQGKMSR